MLNQNEIPRVIFIYYGKEDSMENTEKTLKITRTMLQVMVSLTQFVVVML